MDPIDIDALVHTKQDQLRTRQIDRIEYAWHDTVVFPVLDDSRYYTYLDDLSPQRRKREELVADHVLVEMPDGAPALTTRQLHALWREMFFVGGPPGAERKYRDEDAVVEAILKWLKRLGPIVHAYKVWGGGVYAHAGAHDITGGAAGRRFEIEAKHLNKPMTPHQAEECGRWRRSGVTAFYTNSLEGAQAGLYPLLVEVGLA
jgi:hypothetical protein